MTNNAVGSRLWTYLITSKLKVSGRLGNALVQWYNWYTGTPPGTLLFGFEFLMDGIFMLEHPVEHLGTFGAARGELGVGLGL